MILYKKAINLESKGKKPTFFDITKEINSIIEESGVKSGICTIISPHTTCAVFFEEYVHDVIDGMESLQLDLNNVLKKIIPDNVAEGQYNYPGEEHYAAVASWEDAENYLPNGDRTALLNCDAHLKATLVGSSETLEIDEGKLAVGPTGYVYFVDFDRTRSRKRKCKVIIIGE